MTKRFCIHNDDENVKIVNITGDTEKQIETKLLNFIIRNFDVSINTLLEAIMSDSDVYYSEIDKADYYE